MLNDNVIKMRVQDVVNLGGGGGSNKAWLPTVDANGNISWDLSESTTPPATQNIKGAPGADGQDGVDGKGIASITKTATSGLEDTYTITYTDGTTQTYTVTNGQNGTNGVNGTDGLGIKGVAVNASNHLIVTFDDDTVADAGTIDVTVPIDDSTPAYNKVYSSEKTTELVGSKLDASLATISGGGANLVNFSASKYDWKPATNAGDDYSQGSTVAGHYTTNLITYTTNEKLKFHIDTFPSYFRAFEYSDDNKMIGGTGTYVTDADGNYYITVTNVNVKKVCFVFGYTTEANFETLVVGRYDTFGNTKVVINDLYLSDDNVKMAKNRLDIGEDVLRGKKWAVCGDSFTAGGWTSEDTPTYIENGIYAGQLAVYPYLIGNRCDMDIQNLAKGGRTLALPSGEGSSYNSFVNHYQSVDADADYLTMYFGINDSHQSATIPLGEITDSTTASFYGAWNVILTWLITNRPNLHIGIIVSNGCDSDDYRTATIAIANKYGIPYIDMNGDSRTPCMIRSTNATIDSSIRNQRTAAWRVSSTNLHPNADAHAYEATFIENFLRSL